jgi:muramoyltetrapeptide carboxypeptidase
MAVRRRNSSSRVRARTKPPRLTPGGTVALVAPAGPVRPEGLAWAVRAIERRGFRAAVDASIVDADGYLAGDDARRVRELTDAFANPDIDAVLCARGGYGAMRLLPALDPGLFRRHPKPFAGFSDITALHAFLGQEAGLVTVHGPMLGARPAPARAAVESLWRALTDPRALGAIGGPRVKAIGRGRARGRLVGGCLALVTALLGTPWALDTEGAILLLEDVDEPAYRIDRMLMQLGLAGALDRVRGIVFGELYNCGPDPTGNHVAPADAANLRRRIEEIVGLLGVPVLYDFPAGHGRRNAALPLGATVEVDADAARLVVLEGAVR